jgi:hypothetical protein
MAHRKKRSFVGFGKSMRVRVVQKRFQNISKKWAAALRETICVPCHFLIKPIRTYMSSYKKCLNSNIGGTKISNSVLCQTHHQRSAGREINSFRKTTYLSITQVSWAQNTLIYGRCYELTGTLTPSRPVLANRYKKAVWSYYHTQQTCDVLKRLHSGSLSLFRI